MGRRVGIERDRGDGQAGSASAQKFDLPVVSQSYGTMPSAEWKKARYERSAKLVERPDWTESDTLNASIGQGFVHRQSAPAGGDGGADRLGPHIQPQPDPPQGAGRRRALALPDRAFRDGARRHVGSGERRRHGRAQQADAARDRDGRQDRHRPGPPDHRRPARPVAAPGNIATTACSSASRRPPARATPARW